MSLTWGFGEISRNAMVTEMRGTKGRHARRRRPHRSSPRHSSHHRVRNHPRHARRSFLGPKLGVLTLVALVATVYVASSAGESANNLKPRLSQSAHQTQPSTTSTVPTSSTPPSTTTSTPPPAAPSTAPASSTTAKTRALAHQRCANAHRPRPPRLLATPRAHVMVIMMENETFSSVIGNPSLPYLNSTLAAHYLVLQQAFAVGHPSLPNYLELVSGSTWGVNSD